LAFLFYSPLIMASFSFPALPSVLPPPLAVPSLPANPVGAVTAVAPVALLQAEFDALPLPQAQPSVLPAAGMGDAADAADGAAMRPDQVMMSRQLSWPTPDGGTLAGSWRSMVRSYGTQLATREQQARAGQVPAAVFLSGQLGAQDGAVLRQPDLLAAPNDAWRFTVHAGSAQDQHLRVVENDPQQQGRRRRQGRAALRLELVLADGSVVTVQAEPLADGIRIALWAPEARTLARLRALQPQLEAAIGRTGLRVLGWEWLARPPEGNVHARLPSAEAASALSLPVFRAMAELALLLPA
jgi:hypothetical protein